MLHNSKVLLIGIQPKAFYTMKPRFTIILALLLRGEIRMKAHTPKTNPMCAQTPSENQTNGQNPLNPTANQSNLTNKSTININNKLNKPFCSSTTLICNHTPNYTTKA